MVQEMGRRLLLFPLPGQGHQTPMFQLATMLHSKGFSISIIHTQYNSPNPANHPNFTFHPIPGTDEASIGADPRANLTNLNASCAVPLRDLLSRIMSETHDEERVACLISDAMLYFTQPVAASLNLPRLALDPSSLSSFLSYAYVPLFIEKGYLSAQGPQLQEPVPELPPLKMKDIPVLGTRDLKATSELMSNFVEKTKASNGVILNSFEELEASSLAIIRKEMPVPVFPVGPFHKQVPATSSSILAQDRSCISWLDTHPNKSVLYVSFGSVAPIDKTEFQEIAWGLANSKQPFLWVIRPGLVRDSDGPAPLPDGFLDIVADQGRIISWAPQDEVLAHPAVGGFWTHSGWNSTMESIFEGVPMLCLPRFGDQRTNARYVSDVWRVGLQFEDGLKREVVEKAIRRLMLEKEGQEIRERMACLKEKASLCIAEGSPNKSLDSLVAHILSF